MRSSGWWPRLGGSAREHARQPDEEEPAGTDQLVVRVGIKLPCLGSLAGKGRILYKPIFKWESKLTAVLFINSCMDEKCVYS